MLLSHDSLLSLQICAKMAEELQLMSSLLLSIVLTIQALSIPMPDG